MTFVEWTGLIFTVVVAVGLLLACRDGQPERLTPEQIPDLVPGDFIRLVSLKRGVPSAWREVAGLESLHIVTTDGGSLNVPEVAELMILGRVALERKL